MAAFNRPHTFRIFHAPPFDAEADDFSASVDGDDDSSLEIDDEHLQALRLDDDYESVPQEGDFWTEFDAA